MCNKDIRIRAGHSLEPKKFCTRYTRVKRVSSGGEEGKVGWTEEREKGSKTILKLLHRKIHKKPFCHQNCCHWRLLNVVEYMEFLLSSSFETVCARADRNVIDALCSYRDQPPRASFSAHTKPTTHLTKLELTFKFPWAFFAVCLQTRNISVRRKQWTSTWNDDIVEYLPQNC
jgi:hypothetical protein